jgi:hypothetical protein
LVWPRQAPCTNVHPEVLVSYLDGSLVLEIKFEVESELRDELAGLQPECCPCCGRA